MTGGDDAYFVSSSKWLGVANGVSQWSFEGISLSLPHHYRNNFFLKISITFQYYHFSNFKYFRNTGTVPGVYAHELMKTCEELVFNTTINVPITNPVELLCRSVKDTNMSGSSNILIANFNGQVCVYNHNNPIIKEIYFFIFSYKFNFQQALHVANIGDTGFLIIRHGVVYKKSSPFLHEFHFAIQVEDRDDPLQLVEVP